MDDVRDNYDLFDRDALIACLRERDFADSECLRLLRKAREQRDHYKVKAHLLLGLVSILTAVLLVLVQR